MKKRSNLFYLLLCSLLLSCGYHDNKTSISFRDKDQFYSMNAHFSKNRTRAVERYMNERLGRKNRFSFTNTESDADFTLDDSTTFHLHKYPGHVEIKLDKRKNSEEAYHNVKAMCEGMKEVILR